MKALVLGGSGLIGNAIARDLIRHGHQVSVVSRRAERPANLVNLDVRYISGDIDNTDELDRWIRDQDLVVDAAAPYALNLFHAETAAERRPLAHAKKRTQSLLSSLTRHGVRLAYVSTLTIRKSSKSNSLSALQSQFVQRLQPYFAIKELIEEHIFKASRDGLRVIVVRPSACFGPWDSKPRHQCWVPALLRGEIPVALEHRLNVIDTRDLAGVLVAALEQERYGEPISVTGHNTTVRELFSLVCDLAGVQCPRWSVPAAFGLVPALWAELTWAVIDRPSPLPALVPMLLCEQEWVEPESAQLELAAAPRPLTETARDTIEWYREIGYC